MTAPVVDAEPDVTQADLAAWLRAPVDPAAAALFLHAATLACRAVVATIPSTCGSIVLAVAARAYANPAGANTSGEGPFTAGWTRVGVYLTDDERASLLAASGAVDGSGRAGAFTIDPTPAGAGVWLELPFTRGG